MAIPTVSPSFMHAVFEYLASQNIDETTVLKVLKRNHQQQPNETMGVSALFLVSRVGISSCFHLFCRSPTGIVLLALRLRRAIRVRPPGGGTDRHVICTTYARTVIGEASPPSIDLAPCHQIIDLIL